jgi:hypothetical protein
MECPSDKPYFVRTFLWIGKCLTQTELNLQMRTDVSQWEKIETLQGKVRFQASSSFCKEGLLYDAHNEVCINPNECINYPNTLFNVQTGNCDCIGGYFMGADGCEKRMSSGECKYDSDCGKQDCSASTKLIPRCDARIDKCYTETVDCTEYFGKNATCINGQCILQS